jgi:hypothetical protein
MSTTDQLRFLAELDGTGAHDDIPPAVRLGGEMDRSALGRALTEVVRRHEALRTRCVAVDRRP